MLIMATSGFKIQYAFIFIFSLSFYVCLAQKEVTEFGDFTTDEISLKQCEFDNDADAVVFLDKATSSYNDFNNLITERRIRFKILKERGIERGNIHIRYYSDESFEAISNIDAVILSFDTQKKEVWSKLDRKSVYNKKLNKYYSEISIALPDIHVGSIIEYKYESQMKHYGGLREWIFQSDMPVVSSSYNLTILPNAEFAYTIYKKQDLPIVVKPDSHNGSVLFEMNNLPGLREEAYMGAARDYLQRVSFQFSGYKRVEGQGFGNKTTSTTKYTTTWKELARELSDNSSFGSQINKNLPGADVIQTTWTKEPDSFTKMKAIHNYVKSNFTWNNIYSKYAEDGLKQAWEKKTGTTGEINLILINLLKYAGLEVRPLLVSESDNGKVDTAYPYINQFNKVVAYVTIDKNHYILDGTDRQTPSFIIPYNLLNTTGFIVDKKTACLVKIADDTKKKLTTVNVFGTINNTGSMEMEAAVNNFDYAKIERKEKYNNNKKKYEKDFFESFSLTAPDSFSVAGLEFDSLPLHHDIKLNYTLNKSGDYFLLNYNLFTGLNKNPFITEQRFSDINFGCNYSCTLSGTFNLPENLSPETLPKNIKMVTPDQSMLVIRQVQQSENKIQVGVSINFSKTEYSAADYPEVQAFYKQMLELLNEPIVLKEKS